MKLIGLFLTHGSVSYARALYLHLLCLSQLNKNNHPIWSTLLDNADLLNEEPIEICFSVLSRSCLSSPFKSDFDLMNTAFIEVTQNVSFASQLEDEVNLWPIYKGTQSYSSQNCESAIKKLSKKILSIIGIDYFLF